MNILCFLIFFCCTPITDLNVISLTNAARQQAHEQPLKENFRLDMAAQWHAHDMVKRHYFSHNTPSGSTPWDLMKAARYDYSEAGENLAYHFDDAKTEERAWLDSPGHRENQLNADYTDTGVGVARDGNITYVVQMFGKPKIVPLGLTQAHD